MFKEVDEDGCKIVVSDNVPSCILLSPKKYQEILEIVEDQYLLTLSMIREKNDDGTRYSFEELLTEDGLSLADIDSMEDVEIE